MQSKRPLKILSADDIHLNQILLAKFLEKYGHTVDPVYSGQEAVEAVRNGGYDLVLMDIQMPEMDGREATRAIRALNGPAANIPIIGCTAHALEEQLQEFLACGITACVTKPVDQGKLLSAIDACFEDRGEILSEIRDYDAESIPL